MKKFHVLAFIGVFMAAAGVLFCEETYPRLSAKIRKTQWVDVHAHPVLGHRDYSERGPYPTLEPPISRPFWPVSRRRIAVYDSLLPEALRSIYG